VGGKIKILSGLSVPGNHIGFLWFVLLLAILGEGLNVLAIFYEGFNPPLAKLTRPRRQTSLRSCTCRKPLRQRRRIVPEKSSNSFGVNSCRARARASSDPFSCRRRVDAGGKRAQAGASGRKESWRMWAQAFPKVNKCITSCGVNSCRAKTRKSSGPVSCRTRSGKIGSP
jgi:hypothetical protein